MSYKTSKANGSKIIFALFGEHPFGCIFPHPSHDTIQVQDYSKLLGDSREVLIFRMEWLAIQFPL
jgi:hypothetical protein